SFDSVNGPSVTFTLPFVRRTRTPLQLGSHPSVVTSVPSAVIFWMRTPIFSLSSALGGWFVSTALWIERYRMSFYLHLGVEREGPRSTRPGEKISVASR